MDSRNRRGLVIAGLCAGAMNGLFGAGGGMVLIPLLSFLTTLPQQTLFSASVAVILPICVVSLVSCPHGIPLGEVFPYLIGGAIGGLLAGVLGAKIPPLWLHRGFGILILLGGIRWLC